jgi:Domain of unknown function (DUF4150)
MADQLGARKESGWLAVCTSPDVCKTPMGKSKPPVPYSVVGKLESSTAATPTVLLNRFPAVVLSSTFIPATIGDAAGAANGVKSGTVGGKVEPTSASSTVRAEGKQVVREGDTCTLNDKNAPGKYVAPAPAMAGKASAANAPVAEEEKPLYVQWAQSYLDNYSEPIHAGAQNMMEVGGTAATAGGTAMLAGAGLSLTGAGAVVGAPLAAGGTAVATYGGALAGTGAAADTGATVLDSLAKWATTGTPPSVVGMAKTVVVNAVENLVVKKVEKYLGPYAQKVEDKVKDVAKPLMDKAQVLIGDGVNGLIVIGKKFFNDCGIKPYKDQKCPSGQQAHHIVPDYALRYGNRKQGEKGQNRIPGMPSFDDGPSICLSGNSKSVGSDHNLAHAGTDPKVKAAGNDLSLGPQGLAPIGHIVDIAIDEVSKLKPHCKEEVKQKVDEAFKGVDRSKYGRTTESLPKNDIKNSLQQGDSHKNNLRKPTR